MIARAAEGSARDALSLLDQAIAHAAGAVQAEEVRAMLGLADRALVIDLFGDVMRGDVAGRARAPEEPLRRRRRSRRWCSRTSPPSPISSPG